MDISETNVDESSPSCPKCAGIGKRVGSHENMTYFRCLACARIWAERQK
jgi:tRNA(Ile2) C34 agmatinyltransferase TiaS